MRRVFLVRHGMRADNENRLWRLTAKRPDDPPLCARGVQQARETGAYLRGRPIAALYCSPFLRAVQTAQMIYLETGIRFRVEPALGEWLSPAWFDRFPEIITPAEVRREYSGLDPAYRSPTVVTYPEPLEDVDMFARIRPFLEQLDRTEAGEVVLVGHGATVTQAARVLLGGADGPDAKLCSVTEFQKLSGRWECLGSTVEHLSFVAEE